MTRQNLNKGKIGENKARQFLQKLGYQIIDQNFQKRYGEIDIICLDKETLVFVEVKTRYSHEYGCPEEAVTPYKIKTLIKSANYYKMLHPELPDLLRIDVVAVEINNDGEVEELRHIKNITF